MALEPQCPECQAEKSEVEDANRVVPPGDLPPCQDAGAGVEGRQIGPGEQRGPDDEQVALFPVGPGDTLAVLTSSPVAPGINRPVTV